MTTHEEWASEQSRETVTVDDRAVEVAVWERNPGGTPVVLLHGIPTWSYLWEPVAPALAQRRHVIAPDLVGYGHSTMADGIDRSIRAQEQILEDLLASRDADRVDLVGHDIGGGVALRYASHNPQAVDRLVLSNAACFDSWPVEFINGLGVPGAVTELSEAEFDEQLSFLFAEGLYGDATDNEAFVAGMKAPWERAGARVSLERNAVSTNTTHTSGLDYGGITAETLLLWGGEDVLQPVENAHRLAEAIGGEASVVGLERAYHWVVADRPAAYRDEVVDFLG